MKSTYFLLGLIVLLASCDTSGTKDDVYVNKMGITLGNPLGTPLNEAVIRDLSDELYPDNPDIEGRSSKWNIYAHERVIINKDEATGLFNMYICPSNEVSDTIVFEQIDLMEWIPTTPEWIREDEYLNKVCIINQEWNRQQVRFDSGFELRGNGTEKDHTVRVDLARNCLNSYLWEVITYTEEDGQQKSMYHGWFDFPHETYHAYFKERTGMDFETYSEHLKDWKDPESETVNFDLLRTVDNEIDISWQSHNNEYYPLVGARKTKYKNIIHPVNPTKIQDFLTDESEFSTFYPPGCYSRAFPRPTMLGRMAVVNDIQVSHMTSKNPSGDKGLEFEIEFSRADDPSITTRMIVGGIDPNKIPDRPLNETHKGYKMPMGIGNHSFYETYEEMKNNPTKNNPFYAILLDENDKFIDSHLFGIDGPLFHWDENDEDLLHYWILSFERHALVGHYTIDFSPGEEPAITDSLQFVDDLITQ